MRENDQTTPLDADVEPSKRMHSMAAFKCPFAVPAIPAKGADLIVAGSVETTHTFLTPDHRHIYSELTIVPKQIFKQDQKVEPIIVRQEGGTLRLPTNRVVYDPPSVLFPVEPKHSYLLFLAHHADTKDYEVIGAWEIQGTSAQLLAANGEPMQATSRIPTVTLTSHELFAEVADAIRNGVNQ